MTKQKKTLSYTGPTLGGETGQLSLNKGGGCRICWSLLQPLGSLRLYAVFVCA